ncbi:MAG: AhpC/TSA family protein [Bacteroidales bacterium]|nr:AhpC/TSA family protein [Bacteroidales bacterium]
MKRLFLALLVMVGLASCNNSFKINVNLENSDGKTVYLERYDGTKMNIMDSVVAKANQAAFTVKKNDNPDAYMIMMDGWKRPLAFFADNQDVTITGDCQIYNRIKVSASESQGKLNDFMVVANQIVLDDDMYHYTAEFVKQNLDNPLAPYVLYRYKWAYPVSDLENLAAEMPEDMQSGYKALLLQYIEGLKNTEIGKPYINFTQKDVNGEDFSLSDVIGKSKVIILDFWASWCPDCRRENPQLVEIYDEFKDKGLDIVSVSFDVDEVAWKKAIADDNLYWKNHVSDLRGWGNETADLYTIAFIPQNIVFDQNGQIIGKNLVGDQLRDCVLSVLR